MCKRHYIEYNQCTTTGMCVFEAGEMNAEATKQNQLKRVHQPFRGARHSTWLYVCRKDDQLIIEN